MEAYLLSVTRNLIKREYGESLTLNTLLILYITDAEKLMKKQIQNTEKRNSSKFSDNIIIFEHCSHTVKLS